MKVFDMRLTKLLTAASAAALIAGSASALTLTQGDADGAGAATDIEIAQVVAEEASFAAVGSDTGVFELTLTSTGTFAAGENYFIDLTLSWRYLVRESDGCGSKQAAQQRCIGCLGTNCWANTNWSSWRNSSTSSRIYREYWCR